MIENITKIDWKDLLIAIPAFFVIVMMPLSYSITTGIQFGFIFYILVNLVNGNAKKMVRDLEYNMKKMKKMACDDLEDMM